MLFILQRDGPFLPHLFPNTVQQGALSIDQIMQIGINYVL